MAVKPLWQCDRDGKMFTNKKDADIYDQMLELAEAISAAVGENVSGLSDQQLDDIGRLISRNKEQFTLAFKGKVENLTKIDFAEPVNKEQDDAETKPKAKKVTPINKTA
ncbi:YebG family protein [Catenovulum maritimum]|uniref:YebG family protein n=1 Tax=Catenovulum maritimum TaxID=1513271 RepID=A0A0J8GTR0_9ALTE|nr:YebG family protein [Catenovulum maritimum]KMT66150.1 hypothetical protein XM47_05100 [Catenovulum maritimum]